MKMYEYLLPIGSVVKLRELDKNIMIFGVLQQIPNNENEIFDYVGVFYPEGHHDSRLHLGFNHGDIEKIVCRGFEDKQRETFIKILDFVSEKVKNNRE